MWLLSEPQPRSWWARKGVYRVLLSLMRDGGIGIARAPIFCVACSIRSRGSYPYEFSYGRGFYAQELSVEAPPHARKKWLLRLFI